MDDMKGLTVGIVTRNAEWCLPHCLRSLKAQTVQPNEYIICVGLSNDKTEDLIKEFKDTINVPTTIVHDSEGIGTGYARKIIVETARKEYIIWTDSDVIYPKNFIEACVQLIQKHGFDTLRISSDYKSRQITKKMATDMERDNTLPKNIDLSNLDIEVASPKNIHIFKRSVVLQVGNYDPFFTRGQDEDLDIRLRSIGVRSIICKNLYFLHTGVLDIYNKMFTTQTFFTFFYKYGFRYILLGKTNLEQSVSFFMRSLILFSLFVGGTDIILGKPPMLPLSVSVGTMFILQVGVTMRYGFKPKLYIMQFFKCFGEYYTLYKVLTTKNKCRFGYGWKQIKKFRGELSK